MKEVLAAFLLLTNDIFITLYEGGILPIPSINILLILLLLFNGRISKSNLVSVKFLFVFFITLLLSSLYSGVVNFNFYLHLIVYMVFYIFSQWSPRLEKQVVHLLSMFSLILVFTYVSIFMLRIPLNFPFLKIYSDRLIFLFIEPLYCALWIIYASVVLLYIEDITYRRLRLTLFFITLLCLRSWTGLILGFPIMVYSFRYVFFQKLPRRLLFLSFLIFPPLAAIIIFNVEQTRILMLFDSQGGSYGVRMAMILRDIQVFLDYPLLGVGFGNVSSFTSDYINDFTRSLRHYSLTYSNFLTETLAGGGLVSIVSLVFFLYHSTRRRILLMLFFMVMFVINGLFLYIPIWLLLRRFSYDSSS